MGLFSGSNVINVSSSVYNLAGEELDRPNFLKTTLFSAVMSPYDLYLGEKIIDNYLKGPGILQRSFFNWAVRNELSGIPTYSQNIIENISQSIVEPYIPIPASPAGLVNIVISAEITFGDYSFWAERWLFDNAPEEVALNWFADYDQTNHQITIQYESGATVVIPADSYDKNEKFVVARYYQVVPTSVEPIQVGTKILNITPEPSNSGFVFSATANINTVGHSLDQTVRVTKEYSDGSPTTTTNTPETNVESFTTIRDTYTKTEYVGNTGGTPNNNSSIETTLLIWERRRIYTDPTFTVESVVVNDLGGGDTETVTTSRSGEYLEPIYDYQEKTQETIFDKIDGDGGIWIYMIGGGNTVLNALVVDTVAGPSYEYYPILPLRINNESIREPGFEDLYAETKKAYKKATGGGLKGYNIDNILDKIEDNPDIGDIDYSYVQWGCSVNIIDLSSKRYIYLWLKSLMNIQNTTSADITAFEDSVVLYSDFQAQLITWSAAQNNSLDPLFNTPRPTYPLYTSPKTTTIQLKSDHPQLGGFDNRYTWININETFHSGLGKAGAVLDDIWFDNGSTINWNISQEFGEREGSSFRIIDRSVSSVEMFKQTGVNSYSKLTIWGMSHDNFIYQGKAVTTSLFDGVNDTSESVFLIPLHAPTVKLLGIKDFTQLSISNTFITFNSYEVVKKKWYESFLGMLVVLVVVVVISVLINPALMANVSGLLGSNIALGTTLGFTGTAAIVAGAVTNAVAAMILSQVLSQVTIQVFGEKWGAILGALIGFALSFGISNGFSNFNLSTLMNPRTILSFSSAIANGYSGFTQAETAEINEEMMGNQESYDKSVQDLNTLLRSLGLADDLLFDPLGLTESARGNEYGAKSSYVPESLDQFISRTMITGSDIVDITLSLITDYTELQLTLPKG